MHINCRGFYVLAGERVPCARCYPLRYKRLVRDSGFRETAISRTRPYRKNLLLPALAERE